LDQEVPGSKPWIFCDHKNAAQYIPWDQPVWDRHGKTVPDENNQNKPFTISQAFNKWRKPGRKPYWVPALMGYDFIGMPSDIYAGNDICGETGPYARTPHSSREQVPDLIKLMEDARKISFNRHIFLCPLAMNPVAHGGKEHLMASLAEAIANYPTGAQDEESKKKYLLKNYLPVSATLFHEMYHLVTPVEEEMLNKGEQCKFDPTQSYTCLLKVSFRLLLTRRA